MSLSNSSKQSGDGGVGGNAGPENRSPPPVSESILNLFFMCINDIFAVCSYDLQWPKKDKKSLVLSQNP